MFRYVTLNSDSNTNNQSISKKVQKTVPISLLSGGNSFFVKIKSNQIASNYNDTSNKLKPNSLQKINYTYFQKDNKNKSNNKYLNNTQQKSSYIFGINNSIEYNNDSKKKSIINKSKQDLVNHIKGIYSFTSVKHNNDNMNNKTINSTSFRQNYNGVLLTDVEYLKKNISKNYNIYEKENKNAKEEKSEKNKNNTLNHKVNKKDINNKKKSNNNSNYISENSLNKKMKNIKEKNNLLTTINKTLDNNKIKLYKKNQNQYIIKKINNKNEVKNRNLTGVIFNTNVEKSKHKSINKNNCSEGKNKVIIHGTKKNKNKLICYKELSNNNTNIIKDRLVETDEFNNSSLSKRKMDKRIKSINIKPNNEYLRIQKINNNSKPNFNINSNNKSLNVQKKCFEKSNNSIININENINNDSKLINFLASGEIFKLNYTLTELLGSNSNNSKSRMNKQIYSKDNKQRDINGGNKSLLSGLTSSNLDRKKIVNYPNIIINNNYLYNYIPLISLNNSVDNDNLKKLSINRNSFVENKLENQNNSINKSQNFKVDMGNTYILNYNSFIDNNNETNKENKRKNNKKYKNDQQIKAIDNSPKNNYISNKNNNIYNLNRKFINPKGIDNINKSNRVDLFQNRGNSNSIIECYVSKEKNKKPKQNPPLIKNPKKLNILSLIQENNRKIKDYNIRKQHQFHSFVETDSFNKNYNNKNAYETIDYILHPENYKIKDDLDVLDNFDDMNTIIKKINFDNIDINTNSIFTVNDKKESGKKSGNNSLYTKYCESFNGLFDKKFLNKNNNISSATQNKIKNNHKLYYSKQSGSTKDSNRQNSSTKKYKVFSYLENKIDKKNEFRINLPKQKETKNII